MFSFFEVLIFRVRFLVRPFFKALFWNVSKRYIFAQAKNVTHHKGFQTFEDQASTSAISATGSSAEVFDASAL